MSFYSEMEKVIANQGDAGLDHLEHYYGLMLELRRPIKSDVYARVHGSNSGSNTEVIKTFKGVVEGDDFFPSNGAFSGGFIAGFLYTRDKDVRVGDEIRIEPSDTKMRRYKVVGKESLGLTREIFVKWKLSSIGD